MKKYTLSVMNTIVVNVKNEDELIDIADKKLKELIKLGQVEYKIMKEK